MEVSKKKKVPHWHHLELEVELRHGMDVGKYARRIGKVIGLPDDECDELARAGLLHDIGKLKLSRYIEEQSDSLMIEEIKYARMHSVFSYEILKERGYSPYVLECVRYHHENYDGSGYPEQFEGEYIPYGARIIRVCDVYAALTEERPYRKAFSRQCAMEIMIEEIKNFDMRLFLAFQRMIHEEEEE